MSRSAMARMCASASIWRRWRSKAFFKELLGRLDSIELTGEPKRIQSTFVTGLKTLPVRYAIRA